MSTSARRNARNVSTVSAEGDAEAVSSARPAADISAGTSGAPLRMGERGNNCFFRQFVRTEWLARGASQVSHIQPRLLGNHVNLVPCRPRPQIRKRWEDRLVASSRRFPLRTLHTSSQDGAVRPHGRAREPIPHLPPVAHPVLPGSDHAVARRELGDRRGVRRQGEEGCRRDDGAGGGCRTHSCASKCPGGASSPPRGRRLGLDARAQG